MEKYILVTECVDSYYGDTAEIYENKEEAIKEFKNQKYFCRFAELYKADLIEKTKYERNFF